MILTDKTPKVTTFTTSDGTRVAKIDYRGCGTPPSLAANTNYRVVISGSDSNLANDKDKIGYLSSGISADGLSNTVIEHGDQSRPAKKQTIKSHYEVTKKSSVQNK